jgi:hypothetical protein
MTIETFAKQYRLLGLRKDACGDPVIYGSDRGAAERQLYFDNGELCLMILDGGRIQKSRWLELGTEPAKLWLGDIAREGRRGIQDVKITGIPLTRAKLAIRLARVKHRQNLTEEQLASRRAAGKAHAANLRRSKADANTA